MYVGTYKVMDYEKTMKQKNINEKTADRRNKTSEIAV